MIKNLSFRMFVSSTFRDFEEERNILTQNIYPRLLSYCRENKSNFQAIDMRWGISREYNLENAVLPICLEEIEQCKAYGTFPNFLIMLGDRYGWCPPPYEIVAEELDMILKSATEEEKNCVLEWYIKDNNSCIPRYSLKKREGIYKEEDEWYKKETELHDILYNLALRSGIDEYNLQKYYTSATEQEIISGLFDDPVAREHVVVLRKDVAPQDSMEEEVRRARLLKKRVCSYVPAEHIIDIDEKGEYQEKVYEILLAEIKERMELYGSVDAHTVEEYLQADFVSDNQKCYYNREEEEEKLAHFLEEYDGKVKCICGESGTGKTSLLSHLVSSCEDSWNYVFVGASSKSQNILDNIDYFFWNVKNRGVEIGTFEKQYDTAVLQFELMLKKLPADRKWKFLVDGLDNVHDLNRLLQGFLSIKVPAHVIVAASFVSPYSLEESRNGLINKVHNIAKLTQMQPWNILQKKLESVSRTLTEEQKEFVINKIEKNPLPIYVDLVFSIVSKWKSWDIADEKVIKDEYAETVNALFYDLISRQRVGEVF